MISATIATSPGSDVTRDVISTPPPTSRSSSDIDYMEYSEFLTYDNELLPSEDSSILPTTTAAVLTTTVTTAVTTTTTADTTATTTASTTVRATIPSVKTAPAYSINRNTDLLPLITADPNKTQEPIRTSDLPESSTANQNIVTTTPSVAPSSAPVSTKENNSVNEVQYQIVGTDSTATREQKNIFVPRLLTFHERTQNKRIQQLLKERQLQNLQRMGNRTRARRTPLAQVNRTRLRKTERRD